MLEECVDCLPGDPGLYFELHIRIAGEAEKDRVTVAGRLKALCILDQSGHDSSPDFGAMEVALTHTENRRGIAVGTAMVATSI